MKEENSDYRNTILVAGSGRSGTTWLSELINYNNDYRFIFEPYHRDNVKETHFFRERQYLNPHLENLAFLSATEKILSGQIRNNWTDMFNKKINVEKRLVKVIRANLFLKWMKVQFSELKIVFILRHPFAVAQSRLKLGFDTHLNDIFEQTDLLEDFEMPLSREEIERKTRFEQHVFLWCVENRMVLKQFQKGELFSVFYEELLRTPKEILPKLFAFLKTPYREAAILHQFIQRSQSAQTKTGTKPDFIDWKQKLPEDLCEKGVNILRLFGMDKIYQTQRLPMIPAAELFS